jgi:hypothetical protein
VLSQPLELTKSYAFPHAQTDGLRTDALKLDKGDVSIFFHLSCMDLPLQAVPTSHIAKSSRLATRLGAYPPMLYDPMFGHSLTKP